MNEDASTTPPDELGPPWTVLKILRWTTHFFDSEHATASPRLDAELLLADVIGFDRIKLYTHFDRPMGAEELAAYRRLVRRRVDGEPVAYLLGHKSFWSLDLAVDDRALIPRPETEVLVEEVLDVVADDAVGPLVDVGAGAGAVALAVASERSSLQIVATDVDADALELAADNAADLELSDRIVFARGDLLSGVDSQYLPCEVVASNPPYVADRDRDQLSVDIKAHEPDTALFGGDDGLEVIRRLVPAAFEALAADGHFLCEIGHDQGPAVADLLAEAGFVDVAIRQDYSDRDRVARGHKP